MSETRHESDSFPDRIIFVSLFSDITNWESPNVRNNCLPQLNEVTIQHQYSDLGVGVSVVQDRKRPRHIMKIDHLTSLLTVHGDKLALRMVGKLITNKHPVFKCSDVLQAGAWMKRQKGGVRTHFQKRVRQSSHARSCAW